MRSNSNYWRCFGIKYKKLLFFLFFRFISSWIWFVKPYKISHVQQYLFSKHWTDLFKWIKKELVALMRLYWRLDREQQLLSVSQPLIHCWLYPSSLPNFVSELKNKLSSDFSTYFNRFSIFWRWILFKEVRKEIWNWIFLFFFVNLRSSYEL